MNENNTEYINSDAERAKIEEQFKKAHRRNSLIILLLVACIGLGFMYFKLSSQTGLDYIDGNVLKIARTGSPSTGNIWKNESFVSQLAWSSLFVTDATFTEVNSGLAETYTVSGDGLTYTITLKENLKWSDGEVLDLDDVVYSLEAYVLNASTNNTVTTALNKIAGVDEWKEIAVQSWENGGTHSLEGLSAEGNVLTITLDSPHTTFALALTQFVPLPEHCFTDVDPSTITSGLEFFSNPVCSGMFMVDCINELEDLELIRNPNYHDTQTDIERVIMYYDHKNMFIDHYSTTNITEMVSYRSMQGFEEYNVNAEFYRYFVFNQAADYNVVEMVPKLDDTGAEILDENGDPVLEENIESIDYGDEREENEIISNVLVRQAIYHAIDRPALLDSAYLNSGELAFANMDDEGNPHYVYEYDPEKAEQLLIEAGYDFDRPFTIAYYHTDANTAAFLDKMKVYLEDIGLTVRLVYTNGSDEFGNNRMYGTREYDMLLKALSAFNLEDWFNEYLSTNGNMHSLMGTEIFDGPMSDLQASTNVANYRMIVEEIQQLEYDTLYKLPLFTLNDMVYINGNRLSVPEDIIFGNTRYRSDLRIDEWYIKKA
ncbi:MAG: ABC transporter substrate-binding protein [Eubacteriales bacterium]